MFAISVRGEGFVLHTACQDGNRTIIVHLIHASKIVEDSGNQNECLSLKNRRRYLPVW